MSRVSSFRRVFAEAVRDARQLTSAALVDALATVRREQFLGPGPWFIRSERTPAGMWTPDDDPRHVTADVSVAVDASRDLYNGAPGQVATWLDALAIAVGSRVLHIGCGTGYYSALMAELTGPSGHVVAIDADAVLTSRAREHLAPWSWVDVQHGDGRTALPTNVDVVLVHAGASHLLDEWLDAIRDDGRLLVPLTCTMPGMPPSLSKGMLLLATRRGSQWRARMFSMVMIYALQGLRDEGANRALGAAYRGGGWDRVTHLDRSVHEPTPDCWYHGSICIKTGFRL